MASLKPGCAAFFTASWVCSGIVKGTASAKRALQVFGHLFLRGVVSSISFLFLLTAQECHQSAVNATICIHDFAVRPA